MKKRRNKAYETIKHSIAQIYKEQRYNLNNIKEKRVNLIIIGIIKDYMHFLVKYFYYLIDIIWIIYGVTSSHLI